MKPFLLHPARGQDPPSIPSNEGMGFVQDLEAAVLIDAMAAGDRFLREVIVGVLSAAWTNNGATIRYRQGVLKDCLSNPSAVRRFYALAMEPFDRDKSWNYGVSGRDPVSMVPSSVRTLQSCLDVLKRLRNTCDIHRSEFASEGFRQFFDTLDRNLDDDYLASASADLDRLTFRSGVLLSAELGSGGKGVNSMLREPQARDLSMLRQLLTPGPQSYTLQLHPRDQAGAQALSELQNRGLRAISGPLSQSAEHVLGFFKTLRAELAFLVGCMNLQDHLARVGETIAFPEPSDDARHFSCRKLSDVSLALTMQRKVAGNDVDADGKKLVIITGANRGGKSTFLRSVGLAQLMMQSGMFVTAHSYSASLCTGLFTHYKREEDRTMRSGKFDEELVRMSAIADAIRRRSMVLFNESFAATNEREGSEIARQIVSALLDNDVMVFFVSHMYEFSRSFLDDDEVMFLRADRGEGGTRSFVLVEGKPFPMSFGADLYETIFKPSDAV